MPWNRYNQNLAIQVIELVKKHKNLKLLQVVALISDNAERNGKLVINNSSVKQDVMKHIHVNKWEGEEFFRKYSKKKQYNPIEKVSSVL